MPDALIGRPPELSPEKHDAICKSLMAGATREAAARAAGVHPATMRRWMARGRREKRTASSAYARFRAGVEEAEAQAEVRYTAVVAKHAIRDWRAAAWWLERRRPDTYVRREQHQVSGPGGGPIEQTVTQRMDLSKLSTEELLQLRAMQEKARKGKPST